MFRCSITCTYHIFLKNVKHIVSILTCCAARQTNDVAVGVLPAATHAAQLTVARRRACRGLICFIGLPTHQQARAVRVSRLPAQLVQRAVARVSAHAHVIVADEAHHAGGVGICAAVVAQRPVTRHPAHRVLESSRASCHGRAVGCSLAWLVRSDHSAGAALGAVARVTAHPILGCARCCADEWSAAREVAHAAAARACLPAAKRLTVRIAQIVSLAGARNAGRVHLRTARAEPLPVRWIAALGHFYQRVAVCVHVVERTTAEILGLAGCVQHAVTVVADGGVANGHALVEGFMAAQSCCAAGIADLVARVAHVAAACTAAHSIGEFVFCGVEELLCKLILKKKKRNKKK